MEELFLLLVALSATVPREGATVAPRIQDSTPRFSVPTAPTEPTSPPNTSVGNSSLAPGPRAVRLVGGRSRCEGRVEVEEGGSWGTVCDDAWDVADGDVVCRQLGCGHAVRVTGQATFGRGGGPILRDEVGCQGHEEHLWDCLATREHDCSHKEDAGVVCSEHQEWQLTGGRDGCAGRVEVFFRGTWSTVCDNTWYGTEARVLCHSLGCGQPLRRLFFPHTLPGKMVYDCQSLQPSLAHCWWTFNKSAPCHQSQAAGVVCNGSQGLQTPSPMATVTPGNATLLSAEEGSPAAGGQPPLYMPLFILCLVLTALILLTILAFTAALLRVRKMSAHAVSSSGLAGPVLVTHSIQSPPDVPTGTSNDYREMPTSLPKGPDPPVTDPPSAKDSDSDYEHYDFSSKPPVALSTFYNSLRHHPRDQSLPLMLNQDGTEPFPAREPARLGPPSRGSSSTSSSSSTEPYCNDSTAPPHAWVCPPPPDDGTHPPAAPNAHGYNNYPNTAPCLPPPVLSHPWTPVSPAEPHPDDSSSTSSGDWYENLQDEEPPRDPSSHPGWPGPSCPPGGHAGDPDSSEGSDYDDIQGSAY